MGATNDAYAPPASSLGVGPAGSTPAGPVARPPSRAVAAALSLLLPGLGQFYARRWRRGIAWLAAFWLVPVLLLLSMWSGGKVFVVALAMGIFDQILLRVATCIDAAWLAPRSGESRLRWWQVALCGLAIALASGGYSSVIKRHFAEAFKLPSASMVPTLLAGDHVFVEKGQPPALGDIVVFPFPEHPDQRFIKRVVGHAGDVLAFRHGHLVVNGKEVPSCYVGMGSYEDVDGNTRHDGAVYLEALGGRRYLTFYDGPSDSPAEQGPYQVHPGEVFVVGDNRFNSHDSRMWYGGRGGGVSVDTQEGVPSVVWLCVEPQGVDWSRVGIHLDKPHLPRSMASLQPALDACLAKL